MSEINFVDQLARSAQNGDRKAMEKLSISLDEQALKIAMFFVNKLQCDSSYADDYKNLALIGMLECLDKYDSSKGHFSSFAYYAMQVKIREFISAEQRVISQPKNVTERISKYKKAIASNAEIDDEAIMLSTGFSEKVLKSTREALFRENVVSLDTIVYSDSERDHVLLDMIPSSEDIEGVVISEMERQEQEARLFALSNDEKFLLFSYYGAYGYSVKSVKELAKEYKVSPQTIYHNLNSISQRLHDCA